MVYAILGISMDKLVIDKNVFNKKLHRNQRNVDLPEKWDCLFGSHRFSDPKNIVFGLDYDREVEE